MNSNSENPRVGKEFQLAVKRWFEDSLHITYMNEAANNVAVQCEINQLINDFVALAMAKAVEEAAE